jgi:hypothetical protein
VVESGRFEIGYFLNKGIGGSNPPLSSKFVLIIFICIMTFILSDFFIVKNKLFFITLVYSFISFSMEKNEYKDIFFYLKKV